MPRPAAFPSQPVRTLSVPSLPTFSAFHTALRTFSGRRIRRSAYPGRPVTGRDESRRNISPIALSRRRVAGSCPRPLLPRGPISFPVKVFDRAVQRLQQLVGHAGWWTLRSRPSHGWCDPQVPGVKLQAGDVGIASSCARQFRCSSRAPRSWRGAHHVAASRSGAIAIGLQSCARDLGFLFQGPKQFVLLDLGLNAFRHLLNLFVITKTFLSSLGGIIFAFFADLLGNLAAQDFAFPRP